VEVAVNQRITARDADKDVRHVELLVPGRFAYQAGDALGIWLDNPATLVDGNARRRRSWMPTSWSRWMA
jgi:sulfite reductase (NADPH) flavoprotein alpha-component